MKLSKIPDEILNEWREIGTKASKEAEKWEKKYSKKISAKISNIKISGLIKNEKQNAIKNLEFIATRNSSEKILSVLTQKIPNLIGGSADLTGSNNH